MNDLSFILICVICLHLLAPDAMGGLYAKIEKGYHTEMGGGNE